MAQIRKVIDGDLSYCDRTDSTTCCVEFRDAEAIPIAILPLWHRCPDVHPNGILFVEAATVLPIYNHLGQEVKI